MPFLANLDTDFLESLEAVGISPDSVDVVVNTQIQTDHVGWNTRRENGGGAFVGGLTHSPMQLHRPADSCVLDEDFAEAVVARGDAFMIDDWLAVSGSE